MINREEAIKLLKKYLKEEENISYSFAVEAIMKEMAKRLDRDEELWGLTGLLHNLDYEYTLSEPEKRGSLSAQLLEDLLPERCVNAIKANNYMHTDYIPTTSLDKSLIAVDTATGLVIYTVRSMPSKKLAEIDLETLMNKFYDSSFAAKYNRNKIQLCADIGIELGAFLELMLDALKPLSDKLNL